MGQVGEEAEDDQDVRPHGHALEHLRPLAVAEGLRHEFGHRRPGRRATRSGRARSARRARARASRRCPRSARGSGRPRPGGCRRSVAVAAPCGSQKAVSTPTSTSTAKRSTRNANHPWCPSHGSVACLSTIPIIAITIVGSSTMKPQKMRGMHQARGRAAGTACAGPARRPPRSAPAAARRRTRRDGLAHPHEPPEQAGPPCEDSAADDGDDEQDEAGDH